MTQSQLIDIPVSLPPRWRLQTFYINNNYVTYFARYWQHIYPDHADLFETREIKNDTHKGEWWSWLKQNPWVWDMFCNKCFALIRAGKTKVSADMVLHSVRFDISLEA